MICLVVASDAGDEALSDPKGGCDVTQLGSIDRDDPRQFLRSYDIGVVALSDPIENCDEWELGSTDIGGDE